MKRKYLYFITFVFFSVVIALSFYSYKLSSKEQTESCNCEVDKKNSNYIWTTVDLPNNISVGLMDLGKKPIVYGNNTFVVVGYNGSIVVSNDNGNSWNSITPCPTNDDLYSIVYGNNTFVAVGANGTIVVSKDNGKSWNSIKSSTSAHLQSITYGNNTFVAIGWKGAIVVSKDNGESWNSIKSPTNEDLWSMTYGDDTFVAVGDKGTIVVSNDDGKSWNIVTPPLTDEYLLSIEYGNNVFVAVGSNGTIIVSKDRGKSWKYIKVPNSKTLYSIAYGNNTFVAVGQGDTIVVSNDNGDSWKYIKAPTNNPLLSPLLFPLLSIGSNTLSSIAYGNNTFVAVGYKYELLGGIIGEINGKGITGAIVVSKDNGKSWRYIKSPNSKVLYSIAYGNNNFVAAGYNDTIVLGKPSL